MLKTASNITTIISIVLSPSMLLFMFYLYFFRGWRDRAYLKMKNAYKLYKKHVLDEGMTYKYFAQQFEAANSFITYRTDMSEANLQRHLNETNAAINTVLHYLENHEQLIVKYFNNPQFYYKEFLAFKEDVRAANHEKYIAEFDAKYGIKIPSENSTEAEDQVQESILIKPLSDEQFLLLAECANKYMVFTEDVSAEDLKFTFNCKTSELPEILRPKINRKLAVFLDTLDKGDIIINDWQSFVEKYKLFYSSDTSTQKYIMGRDMASALYKSGTVDSSKKDKYAELRAGVGEYIKHLKEM